MRSDRCKKGGPDFSDFTHGRGPINQIGRDVVAEAKPGWSAVVVREVLCVREDKKATSYSSR